MNAPKIHQSTAMRTTRRLGIGLGLLLGAGCLVVWLVLHSTSLQRFLYNAYAAPALETLGLSTDFSGMDYSEGEFTIAKLDLRLQQKPLPHSKECISQMYNGGKE